MSLVLSSHHSFHIPSSTLAIVPPFRLHDPRRSSERCDRRGKLRVTPTDIRDQGKHALLRTGPAWEKLRRSFELCRDAGADILSIESVGGKVVHDQALMYGNIPGVIFALGVLAPRDMAWLWDNISSICSRGDRRVVPGGDTRPAVSPTRPCSLLTRSCCPR